METQQSPNLHIVIRGCISIVEGAEVLLNLYSWRSFVAHCKKRGLTKDSFSNPEILQDKVWEALAN